jgi:site-specific DNA recombinase
MEKKSLSKFFFAYTRVSTQKQGVEGVSLEAQQRAIREYAQRNGLSVAQWFEERETAAKRGRPVFLQMLSLLRKGKASGVIIHKIDRSARNLKDWADLGELVDLGTDVRFANENYDLRSRGGRLSADIQAVVAADFIRNLREETKKGLYERIRQGRYPWKSPLGYLDMGKGLKAVDPVRGPLVRQAFELYATGAWNLERLVDEMARRGLRNRRGTPVSVNGFSVMLNNPFYTGLMRAPKTKELFAGIHEPLISKSLFERVGRLLRDNGALIDHFSRHYFVFSRLLRCKGCRYNMTAETQKGHAYYRCHTRSCAQRKTLREESIEGALMEKLEALRFGDEERKYFRERFEAFCQSTSSVSANRRKKIELRLGEIRTSLKRLVDGYTDGVFTKDVAIEKQNSLTTEERGLRDELERPQVNGHADVTGRMARYFELANSAAGCYRLALPDEKRRMVRIFTSNLEVEHENVFIQLRFPFSDLLSDSTITDGTQSLSQGRTAEFLEKLYEHCVGNPLSAGEMSWKAA